MNNKVLFVGLAIFLIALVSVVCINCVHASTFVQDLDDGYVWDGPDNFKYAKDYGADYIIDKRTGSDYYTIHDVKVKSYDKYMIKDGTEKVVKGKKVFKYKTTYSSGQFGKLTVKKVRNEVKRHLRNYDIECCPSKVVKAIKFRNKVDKSTYKVTVKKIGKTKTHKHYYYDYKPVKKTVWKTVKWNSYDMGILVKMAAYSNGWKWSHTYYDNGVQTGYFKKTVTEFKKVKKLDKYKTAKYKVVIKIKYKNYKYLDKIVNKPCKVAYVY